MFQLDNYPRNPFLILVFTAIGMLIRYSFYSTYNILRGIKTKKILKYSEGFNQIVYNILLTLVIILALILHIVYFSLNT